MSLFTREFIDEETASKCQSLIEINRFVVGNIVQEMLPVFPIHIDQDTGDGRPPSHRNTLASYLEQSYDGN